MSLFENTVCIFENVKKARFVKHEIENESIAKIIRGAGIIFPTLDRTDPMEAEFSLRLWRLRASVLFTLLPFDDAALDLKEQMIGLKRQAAGLPDLTMPLDLIESGLRSLMTTGENPKRDHFLKMVVSDAVPGGPPAALYHSLSAGRAPGWPAEALTGLSNSVRGLKFIATRQQLRAHTFSRIVLPCSCTNANPTLLGEALFSGRAPCIDVLLYKNERFNFPARNALPDDRLFAQRCSFSELEREVRVVEGTGVSDNQDKWVNEVFWQGLHGGARSNTGNYVSAHFVLFCDGTGAFIPSNRRVTVLQEDAILRDERDLHQTHVENVGEGELVVLRAGGSAFLLNEASELITQETGSVNLLDDATSWKSALEALLITQGYDEVATAVSERGVHVKPNNIHQWVGADVLGPGNEQVFKALLGVLADKGKIQFTGEELIDYISRSWATLQSLRGVRQRAGNAIRQELLRLLIAKYGSGTAHFEHRTSIHLNGDDGIELHILRVACVDETPSFVPTSKLFKLDDVRGNKWLG